MTFEHFLCNGVKTHQNTVEKNSRHIVISKSIIYHSCSTFTSKVQCLQFHPDVPYPTTLEMPAGQFRPPTSAAQIALLRFRER